jgi:hypothetical protein
MSGVISKMCSKKPVGIGMAVFSPGVAGWSRSYRPLSRRRLSTVLAQPLAHHLRQPGGIAGEQTPVIDVYQDAKADRGVSKYPRCSRDPSERTDAKINERNLGNRLVLAMFDLHRPRREVGRRTEFAPWPLTRLFTSRTAR